jgi:RNA polymerase sigma-70 factor (ECF subfamily)
MAALTAVRADDVLATADGGGKVHAARKPITGSDRVATFLLRLFDILPTRPEMRPQAINGEPGALTMIEGAIGNAVTFDYEGDHITRLYIQVNPDKLEPLAAALDTPLADWMSLLPQRGTGAAK